MELIAQSLPILMILVFAGIIFTGFPVALLLAGVGVAFGFIGYLVGEFPLVAFFNYPVRIYGMIGQSLIYPAIPMLLFMGVAFEKSGVAREMLLCLQVLLRRVPGRLAVAVTVLGILLGPLPGLIGASVATLALLALPTMLDQKYHPQLATGSIAAAGTLGVIIPPSVMLFILAGQMQVPMGHVFLATLIPGISLGLLYIAYYIVRCTFDPGAAPQGAVVPVKGVGHLLLYAIRSLVLPVALISLVLASFIAGWATPSQSGAIGAVGGVGLMILNRHFSLRLMHEAIVTTLLMTSMVFFVVIAAGMFSFPFQYFGGNDLIANFLHGIGLGDWGMLIVILAIIFFLGFFIDWIEITIITLPIFLTVLETLDFSGYVGNPDMVLVWVGVLIALVLQTSFMTPPFGFALFFVKGASPPSIKLTDVYRGIVPLVFIQLAMVNMVMLLPALATWLPTLALE
ncbi:MAG: TRAP transporter large permease subunit [SAR324 cluster bacterium]|nr:TRAP transporter large permease subunit [SAR324 cluster bacterium]